MTPSERARERLRVLLDRDGWTQREFAGKLGRSQPWLVKILSGENALRLDDLDAVAEVLKIPSGELIRQAEHELLELTPLEVTLVHAFRELTPPLQQAAYSLVRGATPTGRRRTTPELSEAFGSGKHLTPIVEVAHGAPVSTDPAAEVSRLRAFLSSLSLELGLAATGQVPDRSVSGALPDAPPRGSVAD